MNKTGFIRSLPTTSRTDNKPSFSGLQSSPPIAPALKVESSIVDNHHTSYDPLIQTMEVEHQNTEILHHNDKNDDDPIIAMKA